MSSFLEIQSGDTVSAHTYNSVSLVLSGKGNRGDGRFGHLYCLTAPATGSNTVSVTAGSGVIYMTVITHSGTKQTSQPDSSATATPSTSSSPYSLSTTVVATGCWLVGVADWSSGTSVTEPGTQRTPVKAGGTVAVAMTDSNGTVGTGSQSLGNYTFSGTFTAFVGVQSIAPLPATAHTFVGTETMSLADTLAQIFSATVANTDQLNLSDTVVPISTFAQTIQEQLNLSDTNETILLILIEITEQLNLADTESEQTTYGLVVTDQLQTSDTLSAMLATNVTILEQMNLSDTVDIAQVINAIITEQLNLTDTVNAVVPGWTFRAKHSTAWTDRAKNTTVWTFRTKNQSQG